MIPSTTLYLSAAVVYGVVFAALGLWYRRLEGTGTQLCAVATLFIGLSGAAYTMMGLEVGLFPIAGGMLDAPNLFDDLVTYSGVYALAAILAGASTRLILAVSGVVAIQRLAFELPYAGLVDGTGALAAAGVVVVGWFVIAAIFFGPIWQAAQNVSSQRRLVHWKCRNLVLFLFAMLIAYAVMALSGTLTTFLNQSLNLYIDLLMRVGVAGFLFMNADKLGNTDESDPLQSETQSAVAVN